MHLAFLTSLILAGIVLQGHSVLAGTTLAPVPVGRIAKIQDFQLNYFDLAYASSLQLAPIQTLNNKRGEPAQNWVIQSLGTANSNVFTIQNAASQTFLSVTTANTQTSPMCAQICGQKQPLSWIISPSANGAGYNIKDASSGLAMTSWWKGNSTVIGETTPLTLQLFDPLAAPQVFTFI